MIVQCDIQSARDISNLARDRDVLSAEFGAAVSAILDADDWRCARLECALDDLTNTDGRTVDRSLARQFVTDQHVVRIEVDYAHPFDIDRPQVGKMPVSNTSQLDNCGLSRN